MIDIIDKLLNCGIPSIAWKSKKLLLGEDDAKLRESIRTSPLITKLLSERNESGQIPYPVYSKWFGSHWVLMHLAGLGYPERDKQIWKMVDHVLEKWHKATDFKDHVRMIDGKPRRCASQEANICWSAMKLGFDDSRIDDLVERMISWQWKDGGWNCDKKPEASKSSFHESAIPLRAIALYARKKASNKALESAKRASGIFLKRSLFKRQNSDEIMFNHIDRIAIPETWHYDFFFGLKVMAESGFITDPRCADALDLLESYRLSNGGFPAQYRHYSLWDGIKEKRTSGTSIVDWKPVSKTVFNPFITVDALFVLKEAGRIKI